MLPSSGFKYRWDGAKACGSRVTDVTLRRDGVTDTLVDGRGEVLDPGKDYRVTVNSFMAAGGDSFSVFLKSRAAVGGAQDIDALVAYLANFKAPRPAYAPLSLADDQGRKRILRSGGGVCPLGADANP
jgi:5'-nucleotidase